MKFLEDFYCSIEYMYSVAVAAWSGIQHVEP